MAVSIYEGMKRDELRACAKQKKIDKWYDMNKAQLVEALSEEGDVKVDYVSTAEIGTIVAFKLPDGRVKSAAIVARSVGDRKLKLETKYKQRFIVDFDDVVWVRTGTRWPKGVYQLLKGVAKDEPED